MLNQPCQKYHLAPQATVFFLLQNENLLGSPTQDKKWLGHKYKISLDRNIIWLHIALQAKMRIFLDYVPNQRPKPTNQPKTRSGCDTNAKSAWAEISSGSASQNENFLGLCINQPTRNSWDTHIKSAFAEISSDSTTSQNLRNQERKMLGHKYKIEGYPPPLCGNCKVRRAL